MSHRRRSTIKGVASYRRFLRQLPDGAKAALVDLLGKAGPDLAAYLRGLVPSRTGAGRDAIGFRLQPKSLNLKVGLVTKALRRKFFYLHIISGEGVRHRARSKVTRRLRSGGTTSYVRRNPVFPRHDWEAQALARFRSQWLPNYSKLTDAMLRKASQGVGDD